MLAAAKRALDKRAPFHKSKNSIGDAILIELYAVALADCKDKRNRYAFVTHNKHDFSSGSGDERAPHPDIASLFNGSCSTYSVNLNLLLNELVPEWIEELLAEYEYEDEPRRLSELVKLERRFGLQVWYNRHREQRIALKEGRSKIVPFAQWFRQECDANDISDECWPGDLEAAIRAEEELGAENLGPWSDFELGVINGKLNAIRWVLGYELDMLGT